MVVFSNIYANLFIESFYPFGMNFYGRQPDVIGEVLNGVCNNI